MAETIYTIPINDAFDASAAGKPGPPCPMCRLAADLEATSLEYVMGAAMMEPDVRIEVNAAGFCRAHFDKMLAMKNRLSLALMLESHLNELRVKIGAPPPGKKLFGETPRPGQALGDVAGSCFVCGRAEGFMEKYTSNVAHIWKTDPAFRQKLSRQPQFCLAHYGALVDAGQSKLGKADFEGFYGALQAVERAAFDRAAALVTTFCQSFDHRFAGRELGEARTAAERAVTLLGGGC